MAIKIFPVVGEVETFTAYKCEECYEISKENAGPAYYECKCGGMSFYENTKGRVYCSNCGKYARKMDEFTCKFCADQAYADDEVALADEVQAVECPICKKWCVDDGEDFEVHLADYHNIEF